MPLRPAPNLLGLLLACALCGGAGGPADVPAAVEALLSRDAPATEWRKLGPEAVAVLERILEAPATRLERRIQALTALGRLEHPGVVDRLRAIIKDDGADPRYRAAALAALGHRGGPQAVAEIKPLLNARDARLRAAAARALGDLGGAEARSALEQRLASEEELSTREAIQQSLTKLQP